jgi:hypothetical protein
MIVPPRLVLAPPNTTPGERATYRVRTQAASKLPMLGGLKLTSPDVNFLYKYSSLDRDRLDWLRDILLGHRVHFPTPDDLNDPEDVRPPIRFSSREGLIDVLYRPDASREVLENLASLVRIKHYVDTATEEDICRDLGRAFHQVTVRHRVYSMTTRSDNEHLWTEYAGCHSGYCLELENYGVFEMLPIAVVYTDTICRDFCRREDFNPTILYYKRTKWAKEQEVRFVPHPTLSSGYVAFNPHRLRRIILGRRMRAEHREVVRAWCRERTPQLEVAEESAIVVP